MGSLTVCDSVPPTSDDFARVMRDVKALGHEDAEQDFADTVRRIRNALYRATNRGLETLKAGGRPDVFGALLEELLTEE